MTSLCRRRCVAGSLLQVMPDKAKAGRTRLGSFSTTFSPRESKKDYVRQVFLFTNHMLLTTREPKGRLHLAKVGYTAAVVS